MRKIYMFILFAVLSISAFAGYDENYYWFYNKVEAEPTGYGKIYAAIQKDPSTEPEAPSAEDYVDSKEVKECVQGALYGSSMYVWAQPAEGWQFVGWYLVDADDPSVRTLVETSPETAFNVSTERVTEDDQNVDGYGFEPDATYCGFFAKVKAEVAKGMSDIASVEISEIANKVGDEVTITANLLDETAKFDYWTDSKGNKITQNPYTFTVEGVETYTAHFSGDNILKIDFGEGKYIPFSYSKSAQLNENITGYRVTAVSKTFFDEEEGHEIAFDDDENAWGWWDIQEEYDPETDLYNEISREFHPYLGEIPSFVPSWELTTFGYNYNGTDGVILYAEGEQEIVLYDDEYATPWDGSFLVATCDGAVDIASLPTKDDDANPLTYYVFDGKDFVKATTGTVAKDQCYLVLTADQEPQPDKIYIGGEDPNGIDAIAAKSAPQFVGIYTIDGKQVKAPVKGINIVNGKKVWVK